MPLYKLALPRLPFTKPNQHVNFSHLLRYQVTMAQSSPLYLGFDLSTQQLKVVAVSSNLQPHHEEAINFDDDLPHYNVQKGVHKNSAEKEVYSPVAMWIEALDLILARMKEKGFDFSRVKGVSGAGQQHASVFWSKDYQRAFDNLDSTKRLVDQLSPIAFTHPWSPNWQDHSTRAECELFEKEIGGPEELAKRTGSNAHRRFTGPQILRLKRRLPDIYNATKRITLASSFLASLFLGTISPSDISDVCGMNLWNLEAQQWDDELLAITADGEAGVKELREKLGPVEPDGGKVLGSINNYFVQRYGFLNDCAITPFTGDNPATILALPLRPLDVIVSLGTSSTLLMSTPTYYPSPAYHLFDHPTTSGLFMFMLCYCNGSLAREHIRDEIQSHHGRIETGQDSWTLFNEIALSTPPLSKRTPSDPAKIGVYFPLSEIVPQAPPGTWRYTYDGRNLIDDISAWSLPNNDARAIIESQALSMRLRSAPLLSPCPENKQKRQPRRVYLVGGASRNTAICEVIGQVLGGSEGIYQLDVGSNACAVGGAYKACWAVERKGGEKYEDFVSERWDEKKMVKRIGDAYKEGVWEAYGDILKAFSEVEKRIVSSAHK
ncbi:hypothetical protein BDZ91DRAFT_716560 [Kalaharituber pfeilii]|nr:hypothetical protein BDZ91DRAFT_716560 [Kalaharituber pfeilii]